MDIRKTLGSLSILLLLANGVFAQNIDVQDAWVRLMPPNLKVTAAYMNLKNTGTQNIKLTEVRSSIASSVEIHQTSKREGMMHMEQVNHVSIPAKESVMLKPGGIHIMLMGLKKSLSMGDHVEMELVFEGHPTIQLKVPVKAMGHEAPKKGHHHH